MADICPYFEGSEFCEKLKSVSQGAFEDYAGRYCKGNFKDCARYMVIEKMGLDAAPEAMLPNEMERALRIIDGA